MKEIIFLTICLIAGLILGKRSTGNKTTIIGNRNHVSQSGGKGNNLIIGDDNNLDDHEDMIEYLKPFFENEKNQR